MSWNVDIQNASSKEEAKGMLEKSNREGNMPVQVQLLCEQAIDLIPPFGEDTDSPATGYNLSCYGHISPSTDGGLLGTSNFTIKASNNFVTVDMRLSA
jgi:hypothetical protein